MTTYQLTPLHVEPPYIAILSTDRRALAIAAEETVASVTATLLAKPLMTSTPASIESATVNGTNNGAVVVVRTLTVGTTYLLVVLFTRSDGTTKPALLDIGCVG